MRLFVKILAFSGMFSGLYLLGLTLFLLPSFSMDIFNGISIPSLLVLSIMVFGILGYLGLLLQFITEIQTKIKTKIILQLMGTIAFVSFMTLIAGKNAWLRLLTFKSEFNDNIYTFILYLWPNLVALFLIVFNIYNIKYRKFN